jgi:hypothetical protein
VRDPGKDSGCGAGDLRTQAGAPRPSLILVREWEQQMSSSGCCGRLEGDFLSQGGGSAFPGRRAVIEGMGPLYRTIRERFGDEVELNVVDPRSLPTLVVLLLRDFRRYGVGLRGGIRTVFRLPIQGVVLNGRLVARGKWPSPEEVVSRIEAAIAIPVLR